VLIRRVAGVVGAGLLVEAALARERARLAVVLVGLRRRRPRAVGDEVLDGHLVGPRGLGGRRRRGGGRGGGSGGGRGRGRAGGGVRGVRRARDRRLVLL